MFLYHLIKFFRAMWILLHHYKRIPWGDIIQTEQEQAITFTIPWQYCLIP